MEIKNVIFDLDGVIRGIKNTPLNDILPSDLKQQYSEQYEGLGLCDFVAKYLPLQCFKEWDKGLITKDEVLREVLKVADESTEIVKIFFNSALELRHNFLYQETLELINELKENGANIYILSNMCKEVVEVLSSILNFKLFNDCVFSCDVGLRKPDLDFYKFALKKWGIRAEDSIFIDDSIKNLQPFENLGGQIYHFDTLKIKSSVKDVYNKIVGECS